MMLRFICWNRMQQDNLNLIPNQNINARTNYYMNTMVIDYVSVEGQRQLVTVVLTVEITLMWIAYCEFRCPGGVSFTICPPYPADTRL